LKNINPVLPITLNCGPIVALLKVLIIRLKLLNADAMAFLKQNLYSKDYI
jgi:hypothetical protein